MPKPIIELEKINRTYQLGKNHFLPVLKEITLTIEKGDFLAIMGPSGSGKSTLLNIIGLLDLPNSGTYRIEGEDTALIPKRQFSKLRSKKVGFIFQNYNLLPRYSVYKNVELPLIYAKEPRKARQEKTLQSIERVGLKERFHHRPNELSGGEAQRATIARALVNQPEILLADEPTGNLDTKTGKEIMRLINEANKKGTTVIVVTHDVNVAAWARKKIEMIDGELK